MHCSLPGFSVHGDSSGKNTGVGCHSTLQGIFLTQGLNPCLLDYRQILYHLSHCLIVDSNSFFFFFWRIYTSLWLRFLLDKNASLCCINIPGLNDLWSPSSALPTYVFNRLNSNTLCNILLFIKNRFLR